MLRSAVKHPRQRICQIQFFFGARNPDVSNYVRVVTDDGECRATANFAQVQEQLQTQPEFLVCNRGVIINMSKVLRFEGDCIEMLDGTHLPVRQKDKNSLLAQFTQYQFRGMQREF